MTTPLPLSLFPFLLFIPAFCFTICHANSNLLCIESEREALLKFKNHLIDRSNRLSSWIEGGDCCEWTGIVCHNSTGHVNQLHLAPLSEPDEFATNAEWEAYYNSLLGGKINSSLLELKHLSFLDLSNNNFSSIHIPKFFGLLESLQYLNLSYAQFQGAIPHNLGNLSKLQYLDLRGNDLKSKSLQWVPGLSSLQYLDLSFANLSKATDWVQVPLKLPSLLELQFVILWFRKCFIFDQLIFSLHGLLSIDFSVNSLEGPVPDYFGNTSFLEVLDLNLNNLNSSIPNFLYSLNRLHFLSLSSNQLQGTISSAIGNLSSVTHLDLSENQLNSQIPLSIGKLSSLKLFDVSENQLNGQIPSSIGELSSLKYFDVSENQLNGIVLEIYFSNLTRLTTLKASQNMLRFEPNSSWIPPFQCQTIELGRWQLGLKFPYWLKFQKNLSELDISGAGISDFVPIWFLNLSPKFKYVNLSYNQLAGGISYLNVKDSVDLTSNRFTGPLSRYNNLHASDPIGTTIPTLQFLILSNNSFSGSLFELVCHSLSRGRIEVLFIDKNLLTGEIPDCWNHLESLKILNLGNNNLTGKIPPSLGRTGLHWLNLRNNSMFGELPSTLQNLTNLCILDLSENHFSGNIPAWIDDKLSSLTVLSLRSNNFDGYIPHKICDLQYLQNLDLSHNNILGAIPNCLSNLSAMAYRRYQKNYQFLWASTRTTLISFSALLMLKGREDDYSATLGLVTSMDLSANSLTGEIPKELGSLVELRSLNLSRNLLTGNIPDEIGNMELESLDLSMNQLNGEIPSSFSNLNFLNHFNVSYNNLTGQIPTSTQLQSFENFSYMGNHLCGPPLTKHCSTKRSPPDVANNGSSSEGSNVNWLYVSIVLGFVMGFWGVVAPLFFIRSWRHAYYLKLDHVSRKLYVSWATMGM
ncbi:hypothetical protein ES319_A11G314300v1 [Gossypium barbadense]|uniref:Leucine-rich repeat-containing N-terminal plant-type domain-containing protein n=1 Tax=Gossypium barbadense TaxID=3634 RepID=A0A5J5TYU5_GOSBA|nr:hypothetical protein ES319_A11G314300v1 [Gossypium barbadense]